MRTTSAIVGPLQHPALRVVERGVLGTGGLGVLPAHLGAVRGGEGRGQRAARGQPRPVLPRAGEDPGAEEAVLLGGHGHCGAGSQRRRRRRGVGGRGSGPGGGGAGEEGGGGSVRRDGGGVLGEAGKCWRER